MSADQEGSSVNGTVVYICHPFRASAVLNVERVRAICRRKVLEGLLPLAPQLLPPQFLDEESERDLALKLCLQLVALGDEVRVYGEPTEGMRLEIAEARWLGILVVAGDEKGRLALTGEPPREDDPGRRVEGTT